MPQYYFYLNVQNNTLSGTQPTGNIQSDYNCFQNQPKAQNNDYCCKANGATCAGTGRNCVNNQCQTTKMADCAILNKAFPTVFNASKDCCSEYGSSVSCRASSSTLTTEAGVSSIKWQSMHRTVGTIISNFYKSGQAKGKKGSWKRANAVVSSQSQSIQVPINSNISYLAQLSQLSSFTINWGAYGTVPTQIALLGKLTQL
ncbi:UNVERIFIED_CONTAM: hypothetical protein HDU68_011039 [Siphonaria sp. JEL0065]|nr:hypothetical protein HDU68_011039 [Siphonaria sp. JEL0065]